MLKVRTKKITLVLALLMVFTLGVNFIYAEMGPESLYFTRDHIFNTDGRLTENELDQLEERIVGIKEKYGMEHVFVVNYDTDWGYNVAAKEDFADDIFIELGFGGKNQSGSILLIDFYPPPGDRDIIIRTRYDLKAPFQPHNDAVHKGLAGYLKEGELYNALNYYLDEMEKIHATVGEIGPDGEYIKPPFFSRLMTEMADLTTAGIAAAIALVICIVPLLSYKGSKTVTSRTYEVDGQFHLTTNTDVFSHSHTTSVYDPPKESSSSGGSSSSSGGGSSKF